MRRFKITTQIDGTWELTLETTHANPAHYPDFKIPSQLWTRQLVATDLPCREACRVVARSVLVLRKAA